MKKGVINIANQGGLLKKLKKQISDILERPFHEERVAKELISNIQFSGENKLFIEQRKERLVMTLQRNRADRRNTYYKGDILDRLTRYRLGSPAMAV